MSSGGGDQTSTTETISKPSPQAEFLLNKVTPIAGDFLDTPLTQFPGQTFAPLNPLELQAQEQLAASYRLSPPLSRSVGRNGLPL